MMWRYGSDQSSKRIQDPTFSANLILLLRTFAKRNNRKNFRKINKLSDKSAA